MCNFNAYTPFVLYSCLLHHHKCFYEHLEALVLDEGSQAPEVGRIISLSGSGMNPTPRLVLLCSKCVLKDGTMDGRMDHTKHVLLIKRISAWLLCTDTHQEAAFTSLKVLSLKISLCWYICIFYITFLLIFWSHRFCLMWQCVSCPIRHVGSTIQQTPPPPPARIPLKCRLVPFCKLWFWCLYLLK